MDHIVIISSSVRIGRKSHRVALYLKNFIEMHQLATAEILDLNEYNFPVFNERLKFQSKPSEQTLEFAAKFAGADGLIIVTPEYNGGYPASLKNIIDLFNDEWYHKPVAISTVSGGPFGGTQVITSLQFSLWKLKACIATAMFPVPNVDKSFGENAIPIEKEATDKRAKTFIGELLWMIRASKHTNSPPS